MYITVAGCGYALQPCLASVLVCSPEQQAHSHFPPGAFTCDALTHDCALVKPCTESLPLKLLFSCPLTAIASINL